MKKIYLCLLFVWSANILCAQTEIDVLRYSRLSHAGSARTAGMGGAFGALGGDISSWNLNPGAIGVFRKSDIAFTSVLNFSKNKSDESVEKKTSYLIGSLGGVISYYQEDKANWKGFNLGISYTDLSNFNQNTQQTVKNSSTSQSDVFALQAQGSEPQELGIFNTGPFYDTYLLYRDHDGKYHSILETDQETPESVNQYMQIKEEGSQGEITFAGGTNYKDKLYLGMVIGIQHIYFKNQTRYTEIAEENAPSLLNYYNFDQFQKTKGGGVNLKLGLIYRPLPIIRFGAAFHTPTWFTMEYTFENSVHSHFTTDKDISVGREYPEYEISNKEYGEYYDPYRYKSRLRTPWRAILSYGMVLGRYVMLDADYEYTNYKSAKYRRPSKWSYHSYNDEEEEEWEDEWEQEKLKFLSNNIDYNPINKTIKSMYRPTHNYRIGVEIRFCRGISVRGGYGVQQSPYKHDKASYNKIYTYSSGLGLNFGLIYGDISYARKSYKNETCFYDYGGITAQPVHNQYSHQEFRLTLGVHLPDLF